MSTTSVDLHAQETRVLDIHLHRLLHQSHVDPIFAIATKRLHTSWEKIKTAKQLHASSTADFVSHVPSRFIDFSLQAVVDASSQRPHPIKAHAKQEAASHPSRCDFTRKEYSIEA